MDMVPRLQATHSVLSNSTLELVHSATPTCLLSWLVRRVLSGACPLLMAGLKSMDASGGPMKRLLFLPCLLLASALAAQTDPSAPRGQTNSEPADCRTVLEANNPRPLPTAPRATRDHNYLCCIQRGEPQSLHKRSIIHRVAGRLPRGGSVLPSQAK